MIPLAKKKVKCFARKSNTICEKRRKNKALVTGIFRKSPKACLCAPFLRPVWGCNGYKTRLSCIHSFGILPDCTLSQRFRKAESNIMRFMLYCLVCYFSGGDANGFEYIRIYIAQDGSKLYQYPKNRTTLK